MKRIITTTLTIAALTISGSAYAGELNFDMENAFAYKKSTQNTPAKVGRSAGNVTRNVILLGIAAIVIGIIISNNRKGGGGGASAISPT